ncbi:forkhead domain-containing protein [Plectosphaerella plurivora]|uniref:Forkhead domain-containing protein n=1 Tax=Plectosphaerella plurivora TaxID=936078 RepID=A0A9P8VF32_9PEZI|nr:forkhead domain-containing protein [Plectosphaerella plurivora]
MTSSDAGQQGHAPAPPAPEPPTTPPPKFAVPEPAAAAPDALSNGGGEESAVAAARQPNNHTSLTRTPSPQTQPQPQPQALADTEMTDVAPAQSTANELSQHQRHNSMSHFDMPMPQTPIAAMDPSAYMAMALAQMAGEQMMHQAPPSTVTPSQVTLPNLIHASDALAANTSKQPRIAHDLESFARIEFADSVFQMTTYAVIIGRDQRAMMQAKRDEKRAEEYRLKAEQNERMGLPPPSPMRPDRGKFSKSYVSEEGGMLGPESDSDDTGRPKKRRKTTSTGSSQKEQDESQENLISNRQYISHTPGAAAVDLESLRPSPYHVPIIGIHSPGPDIAHKTKAISREHLRIQFNKEKNVFEAIPLHKNGFFVGDVHHKLDTVVLKSGDYLQIKDVDFKFFINGVPEGKTGAEDEAEEKARMAKKIGGGKEMSFEFEGSHGNGDIVETSSSSSALSPPAISDEEMSEPEDDMLELEMELEMELEQDQEREREEAEAAAVAALAAAPAAAPAPAPEPRPPPPSIPLPLPLPLPLPTQPSVEVPPEVAVKGEPGLEHLLDPMMPIIPKKRGPGRPPKNGIMSKREQRLLKKQQQEMAKKTLPQPPPGEPPIKRKVGRPRKHPLPEDGDRPEKRKYKPRKPKEDGEGSDAERRAKEKKDKKSRPKSPPLELKIEDYTEEQLQKPNKNYGVLIDETLTAAHAEGRLEGLTLKQIYKRITLKYPWFYFHTETKGWESSVRHNLIGNEAFKKDETTGLWSRVPGVELDAGKKRKASSPDRTLAGGYGMYGNHMYAPYPGAPHLAAGAQGYQQHPSPYAAQYPGQQQPPTTLPQYSPPGTATAIAQQGPPLAPQPVAPVQLPGYGAPALAQASTYSSPYASRPPPAPGPAKPEDGVVGAVGVPGAAPNLAPASIAPAPLLTAAVTQNPSVAAPAAPAAPAPPTSQQRHLINPQLFRALLGLKNGLVDNLKKAKSPKAEAIVMSALNRCLGLKANATENPAMEEICMKGLQRVLDSFAGQSKSPTPGDSSTGKPATGSVFDARVLNALVGFKGVSSNALKASVGEDRAEAVTLSAIDRVLGFADASIVPPRPGRDGSPAEPGKPPSHEGLEQRLMVSVRALLTGLNQKMNT